VLRRDDRRQGHEIQIARQLTLQPGTILVVDRAYVDYLWMHRLTETGVFFVTRMRADIRYKVTRKRQTPRRGAVLRDEEILIRSITHGVELRLRRIVIWNEEKQEKLVFLSNHMSFCGEHDCGDLPGPLADRELFQVDEAVAAGEDVCGHQRQCPENPDVDRADRHADPEIPAMACQVWLVLVQSGGPVALPVIRVIAICTNGWMIPSSLPPALAPLEEQLVLTF